MIDSTRMLPTTFEEFAGQRARSTDDDTRERWRKMFERIQTAAQA